MTNRNKNKAVAGDYYTGYGELLIKKVMNLIFCCNPARTKRLPNDFLLNCWKGCYTCLG